MSKTIDERVVEMRFDNSEFEKNVKTSINSLDRLNKSLKLEDSSKSFKAISDSANNVDFSGMSNGIETVGTKFNALQNIAIGALQRIGEKAVDAGERLIKSLTIDPIMQGFNEYELKMNSMQTIMNSAFHVNQETGERMAVTLDEVKSYLNELNTYSDQTIYSFSDMTQNIAKFTNAGVDIEKAVAAIKGISNEAALSGANANEAARAMYNFSQAMSVGYIQKIDWKSIENANMATVEFKDELLKTAVEMGTVTKSADGMYRALTTGNQGAMKDATTAAGMFTDSLSYQWLTADVLTETLSRYSSEQGLIKDEMGNIIGYTDTLAGRAYKAATEIKTMSQMMDTLKESAGSVWAGISEAIFGDLDQAKILFTSLAGTIQEIFIDPVAKFGDSLANAMGAGGRNELIGGFKTILDSILTVIRTIRNVWTEVFGDNTESNIRSFTKAFQKFAEYISITADEANTYLAPVLRIVFKILKGIAYILGGAIKGVFSVFKIIIDLIMRSKTFNVIIDKIANGLDKLSKISLNGILKDFREFANTHQLRRFYRFIEDFIPAIQGHFSDLINALKAYDFSNFSINTFLETLSSNLKPIGNDLKYLAIAIKDAFKQIFNNFKIGNFRGISEVVSSFLSKIGIDFEKLKETFGNIFGWIKNFISNITLGKVLSVALAGVYTTISIWFFRLSKMAMGIGLSFTDLVGSLQSLFKNTGLGIKKWLKSKSVVETAKAVQTYAIAIGILVAAISVLAIVDSKGGNISKAFGIVTGLMVLTGIIIVLLTKLTKAKTLADAAKQTVSGLGKSGVLVALAAAILMAAIAFRVISTSDLDHIGKVILSFVAIAVVMIGASAAMAAIAKFIGPQMVTGAASMIIFAGSVYLMALTFQKLAGLEGNLSEARKSLVTLGLVVAGLMAVGSLVGKKVLKSGVGLLLITFSLKSLIKVFEQLDAAHIDINAKAKEYKKFFESLTLILSALSVTYFIAGKSGIKAAIGLIAMIGVLYLLIKAIEKISKNSKGLTVFSSMIADHLVGGLKKLIIGIGIALAIANIGKGAVKSLSGSILATAASLFVISGTLILLTTVFQRVRWQDIIKGLIGITTIMGLMTVAMLAAGKSKNMYKNFTGIAIAVGALTAVLIALTFIDPRKLAIASVFVVGISALIAGLMLVFKRFGKIKQKDLTTELIMLGAISLVIAGFGFLIGYLAGINGIEKALPAAAAIGILVITLAGSMILISKFAATIMTGVLILGKIPFGLMVGAAAKVSATIVIVAAILGAGLALVVALVMGIVTGIGKIYENSGWQEALDNGISMMTKLGDGIGQMIGAIKGGVLKGEADSLGDTSDSLIAFSEKIKEFSTNMNSIDDGVQAKIDAVARIINTIANASIKDKKINRFISALEQIGPSIKEFGESVADGQLEKAETIFLLCTAIEALNNVKVDKFKEIKDGLGGLVDTFKDTFSSENLKSMSDTASGFFGQLFSGDAFDISGAFNFFGGENGSAGVTSMIQDFMGNAGANVNYEDVISQWGLGDVVPAEISKALENGDYTALGEGLETNITAEVVDVDMTSAGSAITDNLSAAIEANAVNFNETGLVLARELEKGVENYDFGEGGSIIVSLLCKGIEGSSEYMHETGLALMREFDSGAEDYDFGESGSIIVSLFAKGLENSGRNLTTTGSTLGKNVSSGIASGSSNTYSVGQNIIRGLIKGMSSLASIAVNTGYSIGHRTALAVKNGAQVKSPSKITFSVGKFLDEGLILGMKALESNIYKEGDRIGENSAKSFSNAVASIASAIDTDIDYNPTITPVLDLSQIQNGVGTMNSIFGSRSIDLSASARLASSASTQMNNRRIIDNTPSSIVNSDNSSVNNVFHIHSTDPKGVADEVDKILNKKYERRNAAWA